MYDIERLGDELLYDIIVKVGVAEWPQPCTAVSRRWNRIATEILHLQYPTISVPAAAPGHRQDTRVKVLERILAARSFKVRVLKIQDALKLQEWRWPFWLEKVSQWLEEFDITFRFRDSYQLFPQDACFHRLTSLRIAFTTIEIPTGCSFPCLTHLKLENVDFDSLIFDCFPMLEEVVIVHEDIEMPCEVVFDTNPWLEVVILEGLRYELHVISAPSLTLLFLDFMEELLIVEDAPALKHITLNHPLEDSVECILCTPEVCCTMVQYWYEDPEGYKSGWDTKQVIDQVYWFRHSRLSKFDLENGAMVRPLAAGCFELVFNPTIDERTVEDLKAGTFQVLSTESLSKLQLGGSEVLGLVLSNLAEGSPDEDQGWRGQEWKDQVWQDQVWEVIFKTTGSSLKIVHLFLPTSRFVVKLPKLFSDIRFCFHEEHEARVVTEIWEDLAAGNLV